MAQLRQQGGSQPRAGAPGDRSSSNGRLVVAPQVGAQPMVLGAAELAERERSRVKWRKEAAQVEELA